MSIRINRNRIEIEEQPGNPEHSRFYATWDMVTTNHLFAGCALGRGATKSSAEHDLMRRTEEENHLQILLYGG